MIFLKNTTKWDEKELKRFFAHCQKEVRRVEKNKHINVRLEFLSSRKRPRTLVGRATITGRWMMLRVGVEIDLNKERRKRELARFFIHEYYHLLGYKRHDRCNYKFDFTRWWKVDRFIHDFTFIEKKKKIRADLQLTRYEKVLKYVSEYKRKKKRVDNLLQKWLMKKRYYEKTLVKAGKMLKSKGK